MGLKQIPRVPIWQETGNKKKTQERDAREGKATRRDGKETQQETEERKKGGKKEEKDKRKETKEEETKGQKPR